MFNGPMSYVGQIGIKTKEYFQKLLNESRKKNLITDFNKIE